MKIILPKVTLCGLHCPSSEETDHFIKEAIPSEGDQVTFIDLFEISASDFADVVCFFRFVTAVCSESAKIMRPLIK